MKPTRAILPIVAVALLGVSTAAQAGDDRGRGYRDGPRHGYVDRAPGNRKYRDVRRDDKGSANRRYFKHDNRWAGKKYRDLRRRSDHRRYENWRGRKYWRDYGYTRKYLHGFRKGYRRGYRSGRYAYRPGYHDAYESSAFSIWLDGIGFSFAESGYD
jgi:hypothetical protein